MQCDVVLVDRYGLPYRLGKEQPLVVGAHEAVGCIEGITFIQGLEDGSGIALRLPVSKRCAGHDLRGHEAQADSCDRLRGGQQREGLRVEEGVADLAVPDYRLGCRWSRCRRMRQT